ncbi:hypothetical protein BBAD15_g10016 [Beauveria bassiana D1-5]|uniref:Uncharacterized protein n=1 Tax=Beauveria bassiana D1-5 TaxID=1245745 RepID=A0A0A2VF44_BEABA|nr:hypothetical protein BBAD15_g10016 [Beauveria bassiana D1-5]
MLHHHWSTSLSASASSVLTHCPPSPVHFRPPKAPAPQQAPASLAPLSLPPRFSFSHSNARQQKPSISLASHSPASLIVHPLVLLSPLLAVSATAAAAAAAVAAQSALARSLPACLLST